MNHTGAHCSALQAASHDSRRASTGCPPTCYFLVRWEITRRPDHPPSSRPRASRDPVKGYGLHWRDCHGESKEGRERRRDSVGPNPAGKMIIGKIASTPARIRTHAIKIRICVSDHFANTAYTSYSKHCIYTPDCLRFPRKYRSCLELKLLQCRGRPGLHLETQNISNLDQAGCTRNSSSILPAWPTINIFSKVCSCQNIFKCICSQLSGFLTLGNFPDTRSHRFCISGIKPCNPAFKILHRYPVSCASVSEKSVSETLCADQKLRQSFNSPRVDFFDSRQAVRFSPHSFHYAHTFEQRRRYFNNIHCIFVERKMNARLIGS